MLTKTGKGKFTAHHITNKRVALQRDIARWATVQAFYMPAVVLARSTGNFSFLSSAALQPQPPTTLSCISSLPAAPFASSAPNPSSGILSVATQDGGDVDTQQSLRKAVHSTNDLEDVDHAEHIKLWIPSEIPAGVRAEVCAKGELIKLESQFRFAGMQDALVSIRKFRRIYSVLRSQYLGEFGGDGNTQGTKPRTVLMNFSGKINRSKAGYRTDRRALLTLDPTGVHLEPKGEWKDTYKVLADKDVRGPYANDGDGPLRATRRKRDRTLGSGTAETAWIWTVLIGIDDPDEQDRVQWSRLSEIATRWEEELILAPEEMRRVLVYLEWHSRWWLDRIDNRVESCILRTSLNAYARRQSAILLDRRDVFARRWLPSLFTAQLDSAWTSKYQYLLDAPTVLRTVPEPRSARKSCTAPAASLLTEATPAVIIATPDLLNASSVQSDADANLGDLPEDEADAIAADVDDDEELWSGSEVLSVSEESAGGDETYSVSDTDVPVVRAEM
jgi:hypothetical protein